MGEIETFKVGARFRKTVGFYATDSVEWDVEDLELSKIYGESNVNIRHLRWSIVGEIQFSNFLEILGRLLCVDQVLQLEVLASNELGHALISDESRLPFGRRHY